MGLREGSIVAPNWMARSRGKMGEVNESVKSNHEDLLKGLRTKKRVVARGRAGGGGPDRS
jgi:hypothetical protein